MPGATLPVADVTLEPARLLEGLRSALLAYVYLDQPWHYLRESLTRTPPPWVAMGLVALVAVLAFRARPSTERAQQSAGRNARAASGGWRLGVVWALVAALPPALAGHHFSAYYVSFSAVGFALLAGTALARCPLPVATGLLCAATAANAVASGVESFQLARDRPEPAGVSYVTISRLKAEARFLDALHDGLRRNPPPRGAAIYLSHAPRGVELATFGSYAPQVWFRDPDLELTYIGQYRPRADRRPAVFLRFDWDRWRFVGLPESLVDAVIEAEELMQRREWPQARGALERALRLAQPGEHDPERAELLNSLGLAAKQDADTAAARRAWLEALALAPDHRGALLNLAGLEAAGGRYEQAKERVQRVLATEPDDPLALYFLVRLERALGNGTEAEGAWRRLVSASPRFADSLARAGTPR